MAISPSKRLTLAQWITSQTGVPQVYITYPSSPYEGVCSASKISRGTVGGAMLRDLDFVTNINYLS